MGFRGKAARHGHCYHYSRLVGDSEVIGAATRIGDRLEWRNIAITVTERIGSVNGRQFTSNWPWRCAAVYATSGALDPVGRVWRGKITAPSPSRRLLDGCPYRLINGEALSPIDMFNASAGRADPYLNLFFRQPIPGTGFFPGHIEAIVDLRSLLAEGYVPVLGHDGHTVYLVQSAKTVSGGVAFTL